MFIYLGEVNDKTRDVNDESVWLRIYTYIFWFMDISHSHKSLLIGLMDWRVPTFKDPSPAKDERNIDYYFLFYFKKKRK